MTLVVDASVVVPWLFDLGNSERSEAALRSDRLIAPDLIMAEIDNAGWKLVQFNGFDRHVVRDAVAHVGQFVEEIVSGVDLRDRALEIALDLGHPVYDCFYLALAESRRCRLATLDVRLARRCAGTSYSDLLNPVG
ncbi:type II toxin-antitoxin system VapC family toxin [Rhodoplanes sp. TEM]|uniref:Ribonuclease VapC n=1 Tax=Rhodoplanes tepidamans TaxID=200616 RepID=A0ABT5JBB3_RHOTP|nr:MULTISPECIES: type II toxin-antitoxin system VapC family toxin [Rhodoplanes]MDC7786970.1 type II toxin-antitoxin system VapC family toxin [Rhodoplanes tepidamans]MDC7985039.1 type II toxin-antitoxin system VapC family toxin [Rhodoplanes sp. TEM]MDQ0355333.1 putative nucleic acid-binding protein [Rhodoplanes tepidamans]